MESSLINYILHIDDHLLNFVSIYGVWAYAALFMIIFCETGLVVTPFLPGDSLLFAAGALAAASLDNALNVHILFVLLVTASVLGNALNYMIGRFLGPKVFRAQNSWLLNKSHIEEAHTFYQRYGVKTLILARFIPIIRTFAPFVAGVGYMNYGTFFFYNLISGVLWVGSLLYLSYWFGNIPVVKENFSLVILGIIALSLIPPLFEILRRWYVKLTA